MGKKRELSLEDQAKLVMAISPLFHTLGEVAMKLAEEGIGYDSEIDVKKGVLTIRFYRLEAE